MQTVFDDRLVGIQQHREQGFSVEFHTVDEVERTAVNGIAVALMIVMFADSSDEVEVGGTVALGQKLLSAIFGDDVVRDLVAKAHVDLESRVAALFEAEMQRFVGVLGRPDLLKAVTQVS